MISKIFTVRDSERGMSSHHQPSFCNLKVRKNGLQLGRQRQQSVCERCIRIAGVSYLVIYARCHTQLCRKSMIECSLNSCGDMVGTYTRRRRKSLLYLWRKTKGEKKNDQNSVCRHGNICRSPMAEFVMKELVKKAGIEDQFQIASAATSAEEVGNPVYPPARRKLAEHGISCAGKLPGR